MANTPFAFAHGQQRDSVQLIRQVIADLGELPPQPQLGFLYLSDALAHQLGSMMTILHNYAPQVVWIGSVAWAICATGVEYYGDDPALALMVLDIDPEHYRLLPPPVDMSQPWSLELHRWAVEREYLFGLIHGNPNDRLTLPLVESLATIGQGGFINGGLSSAMERHDPIYASSIGQRGISGVLFDPQLPLLTDHTQGIRMCGGWHTITHAEGSLLLQLDGQPVLEVVQREIPEVLTQPQRVQQFMAALRIQGSDREEYLIRNLMKLNPEAEGVTIADNLEAYERLRFGQRDSATAWHDLQQMLQRLKQRLGNRTIRGGIYINCLGRGRFQFEAGAELRQIEAVLGTFPLIGFFANGEFYHNRLYGYTGVLTLFLSDTPSSVQS